MIESARIAATGKIKTNLSTVKDNIKFWNELHHLGLSEFCQASNGVTWAIANAVLAIRAVEANVTEMHLLVAHRQTGYQWFYGRQPEESARDSWNQILLLLPREFCGDGCQLLWPPLPQVNLELVPLATSTAMSEMARLAHISELAEAWYGKADPIAHHAHMQKIEEEIAAAQRFKREQETIADLMPGELAHRFFALLPPTAAAMPSAGHPVLQEQPQTESAHGAPPAEQVQTPTKRKGGPGRNKMEYEELIYRLAKAQEAIEMKAAAPDMTWKEIAKEIRWRPGWDLNGVKLLEYARQRLERVINSEDEATLKEVAEFRKEKKIKP